MRSATSSEGSRSVKIIVTYAQMRVAIEAPCVSRGLLSRPLSLDMLVTLASYAWHA